MKTSIITKTRGLFISAALTGLVLSACGGSAATPTSAPAATAAPAQATATAEPTAAPTATAEPTAAASSDATAAPEATATSAPTAAPTEAPVAAPVTYRIIAEQSKASYAVDEVFLNQNNKLNTAIGVTNIIEGEITLDAQNPANSKVGTLTIDISRLTSDSGQRDNAIRRNWLESNRFPMVTFAPTSLEGLPSTYSAGTELTFKVVGDMTVRDTTKSVTFDVVAKLDGDTLSGIATTEILMSDFNFPAPDIAGILKANNEAKLTLEFVAQP